MKDHKKEKLKALKKADEKLKKENRKKKKNKKSKKVLGVVLGTGAAVILAGYVGVGIGSSLTDKTLFARKDWGQITEDICRFLGGKIC